MEDFIAKLSIPYDGEQKGSRYIIELENSDQFADCFNAVSSVEGLKCEDDSLATNERSMFTYTDGYFEVKLTADYDKDIYRVEVEER